MQAVVEVEYLNLKWNYIYLFWRKGILEKVFRNLSHLLSARRGLEAKQSMGQVNRTPVFL